MVGVGRKGFRLGAETGRRLEHQSDLALLLANGPDPALADLFRLLSNLQQAH
jgi:hypothetical protein